VILGQEAAADAEAVLAAGDTHDLFVSDYTIHSITHIVAVWRITPRIAMATSAVPIALQS
jgi:hypothetical protein